MRRSPEEKRKYAVIAMVITGILSCVGAIFLFVLLFSAVGTVVDLSEGAIRVLAGCALAAGCFAAAFTVARRRKRNGIVTGIACGGIVFAVVLVLGLIFIRSFSTGGFVAKLLTIFSCSVIGGIIGVNSPKLR